MNVYLNWIGKEGIYMGNKKRGLWLKYEVGEDLKGCLKFRGN